MKANLKEKIIRVTLLFAGLVIAHLGVTLFKLTEMGTDPFNVLVLGLQNLIGKTGLTDLSHGTVHMCVCFLIIVILLFVDRSYVRIGTVVCMLCGGPIIDFFTWLLKGFDIAGAILPVKILVLVLGCVILAFGMSIVIRSEAGTGPNDLVAVVISDKSRIRFGIVRIAVDVVFVLAGLLSGYKISGPESFTGTAVCAFLVGPAAEFCMPFSASLVNHTVKYFNAE